MSWNSRHTWKCTDNPGRTPRECVSWNCMLQRTDKGKQVALHVSAWVEITRSKTDFNNSFVALHVSAWVEILASSATHLDNASHSTWVRELKFMPEQALFYNYRSHSTWVRELKSWPLVSLVRHATSHSTWVRELKFSRRKAMETALRRTPRECVSWNLINCVKAANSNPGRTPRECVSWNRKSERKSKKRWRRTPRECVSWNITSQYVVMYIVKSHSTWVRELKLTSEAPATALVVALHVSAWVEIYALTYAHMCAIVALHVSAWVEITSWHQITV